MVGPVVAAYHAYGADHVILLTVPGRGAGIDLDEARRKREDNIVQLRKDKRDENLQKKRMVSSVVGQPGELESNRGAGAVQQKVGAAAD